MLAIKHRRQVEFEAPSELVVVHGSEFALQSVVANLVDNALRAEKEGGTVNLRVGADATVEVVDHGEGVAETDRELIFEPFWRKSELTPGAGLGLAIAKELIGALGGRIWVEETRGGGATFKLSFPRVASGDSGHCAVRPGKYRLRLLALHHDPRLLRRQPVLSPATPLMSSTVDKGRVTKIMIVAAGRWRASRRRANCH